MQNLIYEKVALPDRPGKAFNLHVNAGQITEIVPAEGPATALVLPPLADLHVHAARAFTLGTALPRDFADAVALVTSQAAQFTRDDYTRHAGQLFDAVIAHGTAKVRTHADLGHYFGFAALEGTLIATENQVGRLAVEIVAFLGGPDDPVDDRARALLRTARSLGVDLIGAVPAFYSDPRRSIAALLDLSIELDCGVDVHLDEHLDASQMMSAVLAEETQVRGLGNRVTLSHGCAMAMLGDDDRRRIADALASAGITVIMLPTTNLYLQDRGHGTPARRGLTIAQELIAAGAAVRVASDNIRDPFYPYGSGDLLDIARLAALAAHIERPIDLVSMICDGRPTLAKGDLADLVLVDAPSLVEALSTPGVARRRITPGQ